MSNSQHPLASGFIQGLEFDTHLGVDNRKLMPPLSSPPDFERLADFYKCSSRTIRRWDERGIDIFDPLAVAAELVMHDSIYSESLETIESLLPEIL